MEHFVGSDNISFEIYSTQLELTEHTEVAAAAKKTLEWYDG